MNIKLQECLDQFKTSSALGQTCEKENSQASIYN